MQSCACAEIRLCLALFQLSETRVLTFKRAGWCPGRPGECRSLRDSEGRSEVRYIVPIWPSSNSHTNFNRHSQGRSQPTLSYTLLLLLTSRSTNHPRQSKWRDSHRLAHDLRLCSCSCNSMGLNDCRSKHYLSMYLTVLSYGTHITSKSL